MRNYAALDVEYFDDVFPRLVVQVEDGLMLGYIIIMDLLLR